MRYNNSKIKITTVILNVRENKDLPCESGLATGGQTAYYITWTVRLEAYEQKQLWTILEETLLYLTFLVHTLTTKRTLTECASRSGSI